MNNIDFNALNNISYGMYIVTTNDNEKHVGCVANVLEQITADPIMVSICINRDNYTNECIKNTKKVAINILPQNIQPIIIGTFGYRSSKDIDKFENIDYSIVDNVPIIGSSTGYLTGELVQQIEIETHTLFIIKVKTAKMLNESIPMTYDYYRNVIKGKSPKNAPTYQSNTL